MKPDQNLPICAIEKSPFAAEFLATDLIWVFRIFATLTPRGGSNGREHTSRQDGSNRYQAIRAVTC
jgi:hypothetical protein